MAVGPARPLNLGVTTPSAFGAPFPTRQHQTELRHQGVRRVERFPLGTAYTAVYARLAHLFAAPLAADQTGVGRPGIDLLCGAQTQAQVLPMTVRAGRKATAPRFGEGPSLASPKMKPCPRLPQYPPFFIALISAFR
jgi:hypothetical protein